MIELLDGFSHEVIAMKVDGVLTSDDYNQRLLPAIETKLKDHATIKLWYELGEHFEGVSVETLWDDAKLAFFHLTDFSRVVIITGRDARMASVLACMVPCPVKVFERDNRDAARQWLADQEVTE
ncbi:STAS/SEC14 domain-containing protein [Shewanella algidipiscicola]|uniref:STAS/SEC14 domain-containing protein n=1 Tax=Shewanella algidipiscicola TaxID=614070 RepID=UPI000D7867BA|nr:STAS/SEC14 domain-containing protein [Shewanella algidipiscicola]